MCFSERFGKFDGLEKIDECLEDRGEDYDLEKFTNVKIKICQNNNSRHY